MWEKKYEIQTDKEVRNLKVAVFSDSHTGTTFHGEGFAEHMKTIEAQNPDVVLIVGDFVDDDTTKEDKAPTSAHTANKEAVLRRITSKY